MKTFATALILLTACTDEFVEPDGTIDCDPFFEHDHRLIAGARCTFSVAGLDYWAPGGTPQTMAGWLESEMVFRDGPLDDLGDGRYQGRARAWTGDAFWGAAIIISKEEPTITISKDGPGARCLWLRCME